MSNLIVTPVRRTVTCKELPIIKYVCIVGRR